MSTTTAKASVELLSPPAKIWPLLGDTEQVNRWMGQAPFKLKPIEASNKSGARFHVESQDTFFSMDHEALPCEWENERYLKSVRKMIGSPCKAVTLLLKLEPVKSKDGTRVDISLGVET